MNRSFFTILLISAFVAYGAERIGEAARGVEQVLDDGRVAVIVQVSGQSDERCASGCLVKSTSDCSVLFDGTPVNMLGTIFYRECLFMNGVSDGAKFWCVSDDITGGTSSRNRIHSNVVSGANALPDNLSAKGMYLSSDGEHAAFFIYPDTILFGTLRGTDFTEESRVELAGVGNTGFRPALTGDLSVVFYLAEKEMRSLELMRLDVKTGVASSIENIGVAEELGLDDGGLYLTDKRALACSADGTVVAYPYYFGSTKPVNCVRTATRHSTDAKWVFENITEDIGGEPSVSGSGRFVAFRQDGAVYRYDTAKRKTERISDNGVTAVGAPCISPSGRYVVYIDATAGLWRADCGGCLAYSGDEAYALPLDGSKVDLEVGALGFFPAEAEVVWQFKDEEGSLCGNLVDSNGKILQAGKRYSVGTFPWFILTNGTQGECAIILSLSMKGDDKVIDSHEQRIVVSDFRCLTGKLEETARVTNYIYRSLHFRQNGFLGFATNAPLVEADTDKYYNGYTANCLNGRLDREGLQNCSVVNGNSTIAYWVDNSGKLFRTGSTDPLLAGGVLTGVKPAVSDFTHIAVVQNDAILYSQDCGESFVQLAEAGSSPCISADGGVVAWISGGEVWVRIGTDGILAWDEETKSACAERTFCLNQAGASVAKLCGISRNGSKVLVKREDKSFALIATDDSIAYELPMPENAVDVTLAGNGRRIAYIAKVGGDTKSRLYYLDIDATEPVCVMPDVKTGTYRDGTVPDAGYIAISDDARQIAFASYGDMVNGGVQESEFAPCRLYVWSDKTWSNVPPVFADTSLTCLEDSVDALLPIACSSGDADDLIVTVVKAPVHGVASIALNGASSQPYGLCYTPEADFVGVDTLRLRCSDGSETVEADFTIEVQNVNDAPVWDAERTPANVTVTVGDVLDVPLVATDVDLVNPVPDRLEYSLDEEAPEWCAVIANGNEGILKLSPRLSAVGNWSINVIVSDGVERVPFGITVKVNPPAAVEVPVALLLDSSLAPKEPSSYAEWLLYWSAGCWEDIGKGFQALSLPGDTATEEICQAFNVKEIYLYDDALGYRSMKSGTLPAGMGFFVRVKSQPTGTLTLLPRPRSQWGRFSGPVWEEETPEETRFSQEKGTWKQVSEWRIGCANFVDWKN